MLSPVAFYLISAIVMAILMIVTWIVVGLLHLSGAAQILIRAVLMGLLFVAHAVGCIWWSRREKAETADVPPADGTAEEREVETVICNAERKLAESKAGRDASFTLLPVIFLVGETGSAKTSVFEHSGVEAVLLDGQVYQDQSSIAPTRPANVWLVQKRVFVEVGGSVLSDEARWTSLIKRFRPPTWLWLKGATPAPRATVVCVDSSVFLAPDADQALERIARRLNTRLSQISKILGAPVPVYVLFNKLDRLGFFTEFMGNLDDKEVNQVFGTTLRLPNEKRRGVYAEEQTKQLNSACDALFQSLCRKRLFYLAREDDPSRLPGIYEFPREFRKLQTAIVKFLVALGRPSQLDANPFVRGFYFTGVRPVTTQNAGPIARSAPRRGAKKAASGFFESLEAAAASEPLGPRARRVPQWLFLSRLFSDVILKDGAAMGVARESVRTSVAQRIMVGTATFLLLLYAAGITVSYVRNRNLEARVDAAARGIGPADSGGAAQALPSREALDRLDSLRGAIEELSSYEREGPPWSMRWGLYSGHDMYPAVRTLYFTRFSQLLFGSTQSALVDWLRKLPPKPGENDQYQTAYDTLKAYLITTSFHEKTTRAFLPPVLMDRWSAGRQIDTMIATLARRQFDFYSDELSASNPFSTENDAGTIKKARDYLANFNALESIYFSLIDEASRQKPAVNFNKQFRGSAAFVLSNRDVDGAFSRDGWKFVEQAIDNVGQARGTDDWVLFAPGEHGSSVLDYKQLIPLLHERYHKDFIDKWREYLKNSSVVKYQNPKDAADKLAQLSSNQSYLLGLFCLASVNTEVAGEAAPFQPLKYLTPPADCSDHYQSDHNRSYAGALVTLQTALDRIAKNSGEVKDDLKNQTETAASDADKEARLIAGNFRADREGNVDGLVLILMQEPIQYVAEVLGSLGPAQLNAAGARVCGDFKELTKLYPFDTASKMDATLDQINAIFRPGDGKLSTFVEAGLKNYLIREGGQYVRKGDSKIQITDAFLRFLNRATAFSDALYKNGATKPKLTYRMSTVRAEGIRSVTLTLDGQVLKGGPDGGQSLDFTWPGDPTQGASLAASQGGDENGLITYRGLWGAFRFFGGADVQPSGSSNYALQYVPRQGQDGQATILPSGHELRIPFLLDLKGAPPVFQKGYFSGFQCVPTVAK